MGTTERRAVSVRRTCSLAECDGGWYCRGFCRLHYGRLRRTGDPLVTGRPRPDFESRFWAKVVKTDTCWLWTGGTGSPYGHGRFTWGSGTTKRSAAAYRIAYEQLIGPIPEGLELDHLCRNPPCVNPAHLEPVTHQENMRRANPPKSHCIRGHELNDDTYYVSPNGKKKCRECQALVRSGSERTRRHPLLGTRRGETAS